MRKVICGCIALAAVALVSLSFDSSCANPDQLCRGTSINRRFLPNSTTPDDNCTECVEATCCDLVGDCQSTDCANQVAATHACVIDAGARGGSIAEPDCRNNLRSNESKTVYQCMRDNCGERCALPTCRLEPLVPPLGDRDCDRCFAQGCCSLMNACAKNRTCLLALRCIVDECRADFAGELRHDRFSAAKARREIVCDGGGPPPDADLDDGDDGQRGPGCFGRCIQQTFVENDPQSAEARCLAAQINECGAEVNCGTYCAIDDASGSPTVDASDANEPADAGTDGPADASAD
jgi:hypothetical protein